jgi:hypothetical protein
MNMDALIVARHFYIIDDKTHAILLAAIQNDGFISGEEVLELAGFINNIPPDVHQAMKRILAIGPVDGIITDDPA